VTAAVVVFVFVTHFAIPVSEGVLMLELQVVLLTRVVKNGVSREEILMPTEKLMEKRDGIIVGDEIYT
jgi:hypothetical protein